MNTRLRHLPRYQGDDEPFQALTFHDDRLLQPLRRKKPSRIFVCSMGDLFHDLVDDTWLAEIFAVMALCPQHTFMVLTKRGKGMHEWLTDRTARTCDLRGEAYRYLAQNDWSQEFRSYRVGKKRAGRLLDEREWNEVPA